MDRDNVPLCLMDFRDVQNQGLLHRKVALALRDRAGRLLLRQRDEIGAGWSFSSVGPVVQDTSREESAADLVFRDWGLDGSRLFFLGEFPPEPSNGNAFTYVYGVRAGAPREFDAPDVLLLTWDALVPMMEQASDLFTPFWLKVARSGCLGGF